MRDYIEFKELKTISDCLTFLAKTEGSIEEIKFQLEYEPQGGDEWRKAAVRALFICNKKRRAITARLAVLRQEEKERNVRVHQRVNDFLVKELRLRVPELVFHECENIAREQAILPLPAPVMPEDLRRSLEAVARLNNEMYRWTSCLSYNGSYVGEPEGLFKRNIREIEHIMDTCRAAMLEGDAK